MTQWTYVTSGYNPKVLTLKKKLNSHGIKTRVLETQPQVSDIYVGESRVSDALDILSTIPDIDGDGVPNSSDCVPTDPTRQDFGSSESEPSQLLHGYNLNDYYYAGPEKGYILHPQATPDPTWVKEEKRRHRKERITRMFKR